jgi:hypothetical protein
MIPRHLEHVLIHGGLYRVAIVGDAVKMLAVGILQNGVYLFLSREVLSGGENCGDTLHASELCAEAWFRGSNSAEHV